MKRPLTIATLALATLAIGWTLWTGLVRGQSADQLNWIWYPEGDPVKDAPAATRYFRKVFTINRPVAKPVDEGTLDITADDEFTAWVNGVEVGKGKDARRVYRFDVTPHLVHGPNVIAVSARNSGGSAGLLVKLGYIPNGQSKYAVVSDALWKSSKASAKGWTGTEFDDAQWTAARALGAYGPTQPWGKLVWDAGGDDRFAVPAGFQVEEAVKKPGTPGDPFSLINLTFDDRGRLLVSQEKGPILLCTKPNKEGVLQQVTPYCEQVKSCQGMCWVKNALLLVGDGPQGTGLYRVRDTNGDDSTDEVKLIHRFKGGMGEHGPHAIIHGPDNWLYLVIGNHAWAQPDKLADNSPLRRWPDGQMGPDQDQPGTTEDVLLKRLNDARGHAADLRAPGGTIWQLDHEGKNMSLVAGCFRNHYDAAFSPLAELFTFDSDMEWDEGLPWYRPVRVCFCPPGAELGWRTGSANLPSYVLDNLAPILETGRGSPVGVEFYDHDLFPEKYHGSFFVSDWAIGVIFAVHLKRDGAGFKATGERFCTGNPMNVTDSVVGPDGALYFTMGGRGTQGGVYRIVYKDDSSPKGAVPSSASLAEAALACPQPLAAWSRRKVADLIANGLDGSDGKKAFRQGLAEVARDEKQSTERRIRALTLLHLHNASPDVPFLVSLLDSRVAEVRAHAVWLLGINGSMEGREPLVQALKDGDALVRRRACEALIRAGSAPPVEAVWPLLREEDPFARTAARLVLQRIDPEKWASKLWQEKDDHTVLEGIVALCKIQQAAEQARPIFDRLQRMDPGKEVQPILDYLRTVQLALVHTSERPESVRLIARHCNRMFPHQDWRVNRELAILLTYFGREKVLDSSVTGKLLDALQASKGDRPQQVHYFYCLRLLHDGWKPEHKDALLAWYEGTRDWKGGHSFTPFLANILGDARQIFTLKDMENIVVRGEEMPLSATTLLSVAAAEQVPAPQVLADLDKRLLQAKSANSELRTAIIDALARSPSAKGAPALRQIADKDPGQRDAVARALARLPTLENWPYLMRGLESSNPLVLFEVIQALKKLPIKPKPEEAGPYRALLVASGRLDPQNRWVAVELLRHWSNNKQFGAEKGDWKNELGAWARWFAQTFPKEPSLPNVVAGKPVESKYKLDDLLNFLEKDPAGRKGDVMRGGIVFEKAQCIKCHKYGKVGEGIGPDLTTLSKRFKRIDTLESLLFPSRVISDQYRSTTIATVSGQQITGLAAPQGDMVTVLLSDGTKVALKKNEIDQQFASLVSVMPEGLLDMLSKQEIADLMAFLESEPK